MTQAEAKQESPTRHSPRVGRLYSRLWEEMLTKKPWWGEGLTVLVDAEAATSPLIVRKARAIEKVLAEMPARIGEDELLVGVMPMGSLGCGNLFPRYSTEAEEEAAAEKDLSVFSVFGHSVPNYGRVLEKGLGSVREEASRWLLSPSPVEQPSKRERAFLEAAVICCDAVVALAHRYADLAANLAGKQKDEGRREELLAMAEICRWVPEYPARSFQEALQSLWFLFVALHSTMTAAPVGRFDYYSFPFLKADLDSGRLTLDQAQELVDCLWIKFNERTQFLSEHREYHLDPYRRNIGHDPVESSRPFDLDTSYDNHWLQNMILGGLTPDGEDSTNELTFLCLEATGHFELTQPVVSVRISPKSPERLLRKCCEVIQGGGGMPALFNDRVIVDALQRFGFPLEEARSYSADGCWETLIPGKTDFRWGPVHSLKALEYVLTRGRGRISGRDEGLDTGDPATFRTFDELLHAFKVQLDNQVKAYIESFALNWDANYSIAPEPLLSCLIDGCVERAQDLTEGGAEYIFYPPFLSGLPHTADALAALKKLVFEERRVDMAQLLEALANDFEGNEPLRQLLLSGSPKFGNGVGYVDDLARHIAHYFAERVREHGKNYPRFLFPCGLGAIGGLYLSFGQQVGATPDGRRSREAISCGLTPAAGREMQGPTSAVRSYTSVDFSELPGGGPLDLSMAPHDVHGEGGLGRLMAFVRAFMDLGGSVLTMTVADVETLRKAQREPEKYRGLRVRMGGWQAYFVTLNRDHQEHHIARVKHSLR